MVGLAWKRGDCRSNGKRPAAGALSVSPMQVADLKKFDSGQLSSECGCSQNHCGHIRSDGSIAAPKRLELNWLELTWIDLNWLELTWIEWMDETALDMNGAVKWLDLTWSSIESRLNPPWIVDWPTNNPQRLEEIELTVKNHQRMTKWNGPEQSVAAP